MARESGTGGGAGRSRPRGERGPAPLSAARAWLGFFSCARPSSAGGWGGGGACILPPWRPAPPPPMMSSYFPSRLQPAVEWPVPSPGSEPQEKLWRDCKPPGFRENRRVRQGSACTSWESTVEGPPSPSCGVGTPDCTPGLSAHSEPPCRRVPPARLAPERGLLNVHPRTRLSLQPPPPLLPFRHLLHQRGPLVSSLSLFHFPYSYSQFRQTEFEV